MIQNMRESKWVYILLSILLAVVFWLFVRAAEDPEQSRSFYNVDVQLSGSSVLTRQGLTVAHVSDNSVDLRLRAPVSVLDNLVRYRENFWVTVDVSKCVEGENVLTFTPNYPTNFSTDGIVREESDPQSITVTIEKLSTRTLPIDFKLDGNVSSGYQMGTPAINPEQVIISGSAEQVNRVARVVAVLERDDLKERFAGDLPLTLLDASGEEIKDLEVTLDVDYAYVVVPVVVVKEIPLTVNFLLGGGVNSDREYDYTIKPNRITVSGQEEDLLNLTEISLGSIDLSKVIGSNTITKEIVLDPSLENVSGISSANVDVTIKGLTTRTFEVDNISLADTPAGYKVTSITQVKAVMVRGNEADLEMLDASQIRIVVDMSDYANEGTYTIPARVYLDANNSVGVIGEYSITVNIDK